MPRGPWPEPRGIGLIRATPTNQNVGSSRRELHLTTGSRTDTPDSAIPTPSGKPLLCRLNLHHTWRSGNTRLRIRAGWCVECRKVNPTWSGWKWTDIFWVGYKPASERKNYWEEWYEDKTGLSWDDDAGDGSGNGGGGGDDGGGDRRGGDR